MVDSGRSLKEVSISLQLDLGLVTRWVKEDREARAKQLIPDELKIEELLLTRSGMDSIVAALEEERGTILPLHNRLHERLIAPDVAGNVLETLFARLPSSGAHDFYFRALAEHPNAPSGMLIDMAQRGRFTEELRERTGPPELLRWLEKAGR